MKIAQRPALARSGPDAGFGEIVLPAAPGGLVDHAGQGKSRDSGSRDPGGECRHGQRRWPSPRRPRMGTLELNPFLPLDRRPRCSSSLDLLDSGRDASCARTVRGRRSSPGVTAARATCTSATATATALVAPLGYERAQTLARLRHGNGAPAPRRRRRTRAAHRRGVRRARHARGRHRLGSPSPTKGGRQP